MVRDSHTGHWVPGQIELVMRASRSWAHICWWREKMKFKFPCPETPLGRSQQIIHLNLSVTASCYNGQVPLSLARRWWPAEHEILISGFQLEKLSRALCQWTNLYNICGVWGKSVANFFPTFLLLGQKSSRGPEHALAVEPPRSALAQQNPWSIL